MVIFRIILTVIMLASPFVTIILWLYIIRRSANPGSMLGRIFAVAAVLVACIMPIIEIVEKRRLLMLRPSVEAASDNFYRSDTAVLIYFLSLALSLIYFFYTLFRKSKHTPSPMK